MPARVLVIDNYDSFTYNLVQELGRQGAEVLVRRNDAIDVAEAISLRPDALVVSPGPGHPEDAGVSVELLRRLAPDTPTLGVCLGHQCIATAYGGRVVRAPRVMHGKTSSVRHAGRGVLQGIEDPFDATRYHSLVVEESSLPGELEVTARSEDGTIMALVHRSLPVHGVQFHPESILTPAGPKLLANFLALARG